MVQPRGGRPGQANREVLKMLEGMKVDPDTGRVTVYRKSDGEAMTVFPVDARELASMGEIVMTEAELDKPKPAPVEMPKPKAKPAAKKATKKAAKAQED